MADYRVVLHLTREDRHHSMFEGRGVTLGAAYGMAVRVAMDNGRAKGAEGLTDMWGKVNCFTRLVSRAERQMRPWETVWVGSLARDQDLYRIEVMNAGPSRAPRSMSAWPRPRPTPVDLPWPGLG
jgi:hypothetical protein